MANFPTSLDSFVNPSAGDTTTAVDHAAQHANVNDAVEALEAKLGITASTPTSGKLLRGTGAGTSEWDKDAPAGVIVGTTDSQTLTNKTLTSPTINTAIINNPTLNTNTISEFTAASGVTVDGLLIKDSKLATNDSVVTSNITNDAVTATKIDWASTGADGGIWWEELGRTTLGAPADTITVSSLPARRYLTILIWTEATGGTTAGMFLRFNNDTGNNYADRYSSNGGADTTTTSVSGMVVRPGTLSSGSSAYSIAEVINIASKEKTLNHRSSGGATGAANAPGRLEGAGKWANTSNQISRVDYVNVSGTGDFAAGSELVVLGHN